MKKRNKKHNKMRSALASAKIGLKSLAVFHSDKAIQNNETCIAVNYKTARQVSVGASMAKAVASVRHLWNIHIVVSGKESNGKNRFEVEEIKISEPLYHDQLIDYLNEAHESLALEFQERNTMTNRAWLAVPNGDSITNEQIDSILTAHKAW